LSHFVLKLQLFLQFLRRCNLRRRSGAPFEPRAYRVVLELGLVADDGSINIGGFYVAPCVHDVLGHDAETVLSFKQRRCARGKFFRQHGEVADSGIDRGGFPLGVLVDGSSARDECIHVRDADSDLYLAVGDGFGHFDLIEVARGVVVDRGPEQVPQVVNVVTFPPIVSRIFSCGDHGRMLLQVGKLRGDFRRKVRIETAGAHDFPGGGLQVEMSGIGVVHVVPGLS